jgi:enamine deaminase RidA (YjgF/YER057c/UK114 family)
LPDGASDSASVTAKQCSKRSRPFRRTICDRVGQSAILMPSLAAGFQRAASVVRLLFVLQDDRKASIVVLLYEVGGHVSAEARLKELGLVLPPVPKPVANFLPYRRVGNLLFLSGQGPRDENGASLTGKLGADVSLEEGYRRARLVGLGLLAAMRDALGSLDRVDFVVKLLGMVNATPDFNDSPKVINGCSDLFVEVFGEAGRHARSAVGNVMLPNQISVEIEGIIATKA